MKFQQVFHALITATTLMTVDAQECFDSLAELEVAILNRTDFSSIETYKLCANTVFERDFNQSFNGFFGIRPRRNTRIICGDDGASSNRFVPTNESVAPPNYLTLFDSCVLSKGAIPIFVNPSNGIGSESENITNVEFSGLTISNATSIAALVIGDGPITFTDCIFKVCAFLYQPT